MFLLRCLLSIGDDLGIGMNGFVSPLLARWSSYRKIKFYIVSKVVSSPYLLQRASFLMHQLH